MRRVEQKRDAMMEEGLTDFQAILIAQSDINDRRRDLVAPDEPEGFLRIGSCDNPSARSVEGGMEIERNERFVFNYEDANIREENCADRICRAAYQDLQPA